MAVDLRIEPYPTYLKAVVVGMIGPLDAQNVIVEVLKACDTYRLPQVVVDWRQMSLTVPMTTSHRFEFASFIAEQVVHLRARGLARIRLAFVADPVYIDPKRFGETVATNRGAALKVTDDMAEALAWLGVEQVDDQGSSANSP